MLTRRFHPILLLVAAVLIFGIFDATAIARQSQKSQSDLRRENERLRTRVSDLEQELTRSMRENQELLDRIAALEAELAAAKQAAGPTRSAPPPLTPDPVSIDESTPDASPRALLKEIKKSYVEATAEFESIGEEGSSERVTYLRELRRWASRVNRQQRSQVDWYVQIVDRARSVGRGYVLRLQAVDPETGTVLGDPFDARLTRAVANRLQRYEREHGLDETLVVRGVLIPEVRINEERLEEGPFDNPRFIGPFAEFTMALDVNTILPRSEYERLQPERDTPKAP
jgi:hypothetical protein